MKVFISSVISGFEEYRDAARSAIETLGHEVIVAEDFPANASTPQQVCLDGVRRADLVILVLGERYGHTQASGLSATHEEFHEARDRKPVLLFVQEGVARDEQQQAFVTEAQEWQSGGLSRAFTTPETLRDALVRAVHDHAVADARGTIDEEDSVSRAIAQLPQQDSRDPRVVHVVVAGSPRQGILRPAEVESAELRESLLRDLTFGGVRLFDHASGTVAVTEGDRLVLRSDASCVAIDPEGIVHVSTTPTPADTPMNRYAISNPVLIHEHVVGALETALRVAAAVLDEIDPSHRLTHLAVAAGLVRSGWYGWTTQAEFDAAPDTYVMNVQQHGTIAASPVPRFMPRAVLAQRTSDFAEDLAIMLRRIAMNAPAAFV